MDCQSLLVGSWGTDTTGTGGTHPVQQALGDRLVEHEEVEIDPGPASGIHPERRPKLTIYGEPLYRNDHCG